MYEDVYYKIILLKSWNQPGHPSLGELIISAACKPWNIGINELDVHRATSTGIKQCLVKKIKHIAK